MYSKSNHIQLINSRRSSGRLTVFQLFNCAIFEQLQSFIVFQLFTNLTIFITLASTCTSIPGIIFFICAMAYCLFYTHTGIYHCFIFVLNYISYYLHSYEICFVRVFDFFIPLIILNNFAAIFLFFIRNIFYQMDVLQYYRSYRTCLYQWWMDSNEVHITKHWPNQPLLIIHWYTFYS